MVIPPNDSKSLKSLCKVAEKVIMEPLPIILIRNLTHHPDLYNKDLNKLDSKPYEFLVAKDLMVVNNNEPTRKDRIIDLTIMSNCLKDRVLK